MICIKDMHIVMLKLVLVAKGEITRKEEGKWLGIILYFLDEKSALE